MPYGPSEQNEQNDSFERNPSVRDGNKEANALQDGHAGESQVDTNTGDDWADRQNEKVAPKDRPESKSDHVDSSSRGGRDKNAGAPEVVQPNESFEKESKQMCIVVINDFEEVAFDKWTNKTLKNEEQAKAYLSLNGGGNDLYERCSDGVLLCVMINYICRRKGELSIIFEKCINLPAAGKPLSKHQKMENCSLAINSAKLIGCNIMNIDSDDILKGDTTKFFKVLPSIIWQVIKMGLLMDITLPEHPNLVLMFNPGEVLANPRLLLAEQLLMRWVN